MSKKKLKGQKLDLSDIKIGPDLPTAPAPRADGDEGLFRRDQGRRRNDYDAPSRDTGDNWRGGGGGRGGGFDDRRGGGGFDDRRGGGGFDDRRGGGGFDDRRGGGGFDDRRGGGGFDDRRGGGGFDDRRGGGGFDDRRGGGGFDDRRGGGGFGDRRGGGGFDDRRGGGGFDDRRGGGGFDDRGSGEPPAGRTPLNLAPRTRPVQSPPVAPEASTKAEPAKPANKWDQLNRQMGSGPSTGTDSSDRWGNLPGARTRVEPPAATGRFAFANERDAPRRDDGFGRRDDGYGRRDDGYGRRDDGYGRRDDGYGRRDDGYDRRDGGRFGRRDDGPARRDDGYGRRDDGPVRRDAGRDAPATPEQAQAQAAQEAKQKKKEEAKAKKAAEEKARREEEEKKRAEKEKAKAEAAAAEERLKQTATEIAQSGKVGPALVEVVKGFSDVSIRFTLLALLEPMGQSVTSGEWIQDDQLGALCKHLCAGQRKKQAEVLYALHEAFDKISFPRDEKNEGLIQKVFFSLYNADVVEEEGFQEWRYAEEDQDIPGKLSALTQCTDFFLWLDEPDEEESDEEDEVDEALERPINIP